MHPLSRDLSFSLRLFRRNPGFTTLSVLILGLGIGATAAIFSLIYGVLLNPLPYRDPDRLVVIWSDFGKFGGGAARLYRTGRLFRLAGTQPQLRGHGARTCNTNRTFTALDQPVTPLTHHVVTANYFDVLGVRAFRGRTFRRGRGPAGTRPRRRHQLLALAVASSAASERRSERPWNWTGERGAGRRAAAGLPHAQQRRSPRSPICGCRLLSSSSGWIAWAAPLVVFGRLRPGVTAQAGSGDDVALGNVIAREHAANTQRPGRLRAA